MVRAIHPVHPPGRDENHAAPPSDQDAEEEPSDRKNEAVEDEDGVEVPPNPENAQRLLTQMTLDDASLKKLEEPLLPCNFDSLSRGTCCDVSFTSCGFFYPIHLLNCCDLNLDELVKQIDQKLTSGEIKQKEFLSAVQQWGKKEAKEKEESKEKAEPDTPQKSDQEEDELVSKPIDPHEKALTYANAWFSKKDVKSLDHGQLSVLAAPFFSSETDLSRELKCTCGTNHVTFICLTTVFDGQLLKYTVYLQLFLKCR